MKKKIKSFFQKKKRRSNRFQQKSTTIFLKIKIFSKRRKLL